MAKTNTYELLIILDPNKYAQNPGEVGNLSAGLVAKCGGEVLVSRLWSEQKLAFPVDGHKKGVYWLTYFTLDTSKFTELNRELRLAEAVLRHQAIRLDARVVEPLVEAAKGNRTPRPAADPATTVPMGGGRSRPLEEAPEGLN